MPISIRYYTLRTDEGLSGMTDTGFDALEIPFNEFRDEFGAFSDAYGYAFRQESIVLQPDLTQRRADRIETALQRMNPQGSMQTDEIHRPHHTVAEFVKEWTFLDEHGKPVPVTTDGFADFPMQVARDIYGLVLMRSQPNVMRLGDFFTKRSSTKPESPGT